MLHSSEIFRGENGTFRKIKMFVRSLAINFKAVANVKISTASAMVVAISDFRFRPGLLGDHDNVPLCALFNPGSWE